MQQKFFQAISKDTCKKRLVKWRVNDQKVSHVKLTDTKKKVLRSITNK